MKKQYTLIGLLLWSLSIFAQSFNDANVELNKNISSKTYDNLDATLLGVFPETEMVKEAKPQAMQVVNCCDADGVVDLCYLSGADFCGNSGSCPEYSLDGAFMQNALTQKLNSSANFGPNGVVDCNMELKELTDVSSVQAINDCGCDIIFLPSVFVDPVTNQQNLDVTFIPDPIMQNIYDWSLECDNNIVIATQGEANQWGYTTQNQNQNPNTPVAGTSLNAIFDGPFGSLNSFNQGGSYQGVFTGVPATGIEVLANDANGNPTVGLDLFSNDIVVGDIGIFCSGGAGVVSSGPGVNNNNDILILNIFALACELSGETIETFETVNICEGDTVEVFGDPVNMAGVFSETYAAANDCDSIHTITVVVFPVKETSEDIEICDGETVDIFGNQVGVAGTYSETFTSSDGCDSTHTINLTVFPVKETSEDVEICDGETTDVFGNQVGTAGVYSETFTSSDGCDSTHIITLIVFPVYETSEDIEICQGETIEIFGNPVDAAGTFSETFNSVDGCDSTHTVMVSVLPAPETFETISICDNESIDIFGNIVNTAGIYTETFTTADGCDSIHTITLIVLPTFQTSEDISICPGDIIDIFGTPTGIAGIYTKTFAAGNGCDSTHTINLEVYDAISVDISSADVACNGGMDGSATAMASGGVGGFSYEWSNGNLTSTADGLSAGTYDVTVIDEVGCTGTSTVTINEPTAVVVSASGVNVTCDVLGSASASASGGTGDLSFEWNTGATSTDIDGLMAGDYTVTVTDEHDCTATASVTITGALGPNDAVINIDQNVTEDEPDGGAISVQVSGGTAPFSYDWEHGATGDTLTNLSSGEYTVTVTDDMGCTITASVKLFVAACTGGNIWDDRNRNACKDGGEPGIEGVSLSLFGIDIWGDTVMATTTTNFFGEYIFEGLPPGDYEVSMDIPAGYNLTPANACSDDFTDSDFGANGTTTDVISLVEGHCCLIVYGGLYDACGNIYDPGTICCDQTLCGPGNVPAPITSASAPQGASNLEYMWFFANSKYNGSWQKLKDGSGQLVSTASYSPGALSETTQYIRCVRAVGCSDWLETNIVTITVDDIAVAAIEAPGMVCVGDAVTLTAAGNPAGASYHWDFGPKASPQTSSSANPTVTWNQWGYVKITLTVTYSGCVSTDEYALIVSNSAVLCGSSLLAQDNDANSITPVSASNKMGFAVYPNPAAEVLNIEWDAEIETDIQLEIIGVEGRILLQESIESGNRNHRLELLDMNPGLYMLRLRFGEGEQEVFQWVKQ